MPGQHTGGPPLTRERRPVGRAANLETQQRYVDTWHRSKTQAWRVLRRQHLTRRLCLLGSRVVFEFLDELVRHLDLAEEIDGRLERYAALDLAVLKAVGGDQFPPGPLRAVGGAR
jgi:hypothetical protein